MSSTEQDQTASLSVRYDVTMEWLDKLLPESPWCLVGFPPNKGGSKCQTFAPGDVEAATAFLAELHEWKWGCYWQPTPPELGTESKPGRDALSALTCFMVDIDSKNKGQTLEEQLAASLERLTTKLPKGVPPPTAIMFSGGGYQAFWFFKHALTKTPENIAHVEGVNRWLCQMFGGDTACIDVSHAMRLPGTINFPGDVKIADGRVPALTKRLDLNGPRYDADDKKFQQMQKATPKVAATSVAAAEPVDDLYLNKLKDGWKDFLVTGVCPPEMIAAKQKGDKTPSGMFLSLCMALMQAGLSPAQTKWVLTNNGKFDDYLRKHGDAWLDKTLATAEALVTRQPRIKEKAPLAAADLFRSFDHQNLICYRKEWLDWNGYCYRALEEATVNAELTRFLRTCVVSKKVDEGFTDVPYDVTPKFRNNVREMLADTSHMPSDEATMPFWRPGTDEGMPPASECVVCRNGILHVATGTLYPLTPNYVTRTAIACNWNPAARASLLLQCLEDWFPLDAPERDKDVGLLQEFFGYGLTSDKRFQKALIAVGKSRSGKGTIQRLVTKLMGRETISTPSMSSLGESFGLSQLTDALLAWVPDARIDHRKGNIEVSTLMLSQIGNDGQNVNQKHKAYERNVDLPAKFVISSNELPKFTDNTGVVAQRFLPVEFRVSFAGREDHTLDARLAAEVEGVLVWLVEGYQRLLARGKFDPSQRTLAAVRDMVAMASPFQGWLAERAVLGEQHWGEIDVMYDDYDRWMQTNGQARYVMARNAFGRQLKGVTGSDRTRRGGKGEQFYGYRGIGLRRDAGVYEDVPEDSGP